MEFTHDDLLSVIYNDLLPVYKKQYPDASLEDLVAKARKAKLPALCREFYNAD